MKNEPGMAFNMKTLNKVFAFCSIVLLITVIWMVLDDFIRPWKAVQVKGLEIKRQHLAKKIAELDGKVDKTAVAKMEKKIITARAGVESKQGEINKINDEVSLLDKKIKALAIKNGNSSAFSGMYQFNYEHAVAHNDKKHANETKPNLDKYRAMLAQGKDQVKVLKIEKKRITAKIRVIKKEQTDLEISIKKLVGTRDRFIASYDKTEKSPVWFLRNSPFVDFLDPTIKIQQVVVDKALDDRYFVKVPKVDRCTTCHLFIGDKGYEEQDNPYKTHPKIDSLAVGINSNHPIKDFGCTSCHQGEGHRVFDFNSPVHIPDSKEKAIAWKKKYNWHAPHKKPSPMMPLKYTESQCLKCHQGVERVPMAAKLNKGRELIEQYGCYACHKIDGWQHLKKPGPMLTKIKSKVSKEFMKNWIWSPHAFNPKSKMPAFFAQTNNSKPEFMQKNIAEVNAMAEYLWNNSRDYKPSMKYRGGNAERGKGLIQEVGCISCHEVKGVDANYAKVGSRKGPYLAGLGSKVDKDWLVSWLKKPSHFSAETVMPSFRLTDKEANDIAAFLLNDKNKYFEKLKFESADPKVRDEILLTYFAAFEPIKMAEAKLAKMSEQEKEKELGYRSIGKYGCYSCHTISGFKANRAPIGPDLSGEGSKPVTQFGYGLQHQIGHNRHEWISAHLKNPRIWDSGLPKPFKDLNRMPNFYLREDEIDAIVTALLGQVTDPIPMNGMRLLSANEKIAEKGKKIVRKFNCEGCHKIDGQGGLLVKALEDPGEGAPYLVKEGHRVQADWFFNFLENVYPIRPWVKVRMPNFNLTHEQKSDIVAYFQADANQTTFAKGNYDWKWEPGEEAAAKKIFNELACTSCHTGGFNNDEAQGPNLHNVKKRLRFSWVEGWLASPQSYLDYTSMPDFWDGGKESAVEGVLDDDPKRQIRAVTKYLMQIGNNEYPIPFKKD
jgi:mono/diheme cytochrome c family protein